MLEINNVYNTDCIEGLKQMPSKSVDMFFVDLPYGVTAKNKWDVVIPLEPMWKEVKRVMKDNGVILFFGQDKFTARVMLSNSEMHRYNLIWDKGLVSGFLNANRQPLREHEDIMVFYKKQPTYNPQKTEGKPCHSKGKALGNNSDLGNNNNYNSYTVVETKGTLKYPTSILYFPKPHPSTVMHPTQKSLDLCRYLVRTYSNEGDLVVDFCCGSGTILKAAQLEGRKYIGMDNGVCDRQGKFENWFWSDVAKYRLEAMQE